MSRVTTAAQRYGRFTEALHGILPGWLQWIPATWIGWAILSLSTFALDIALLSLLVHVFHVWYSIAVTIGFLTAAAVNFLLNKWLNFRSRGHMARQSGKQTVVVVSNYLLWVLGLSSLLEWAGAAPEIARICAAVVEGFWMYFLMRFWVFHSGRDRGTHGSLG